jgi:molybdate transport system ATP-binding protein
VSSLNAADLPGIRLALHATYPGFRADFEFDIAPRGVTALFGASGSGKTTCLRLLAGLERGQGSVYALGECWQDDNRRIFVPTHRRRIGYVFQEPSLFPHLSVRQNLRYAERRRPASGVDFERAVAVLGIGGLLERSPDGLSGGERQRVAIARALLVAPRLMLMDEPLSALDDARKSEVLPYLEAVRDELGIPLVYVSHSLDEVSRLADRVVLLDAGRVVASGPVAEMLARLDLSLSRADEAGAVIHATVAHHERDDGLTRLDFAGDSLWIPLLERPLGAAVRARVFARDVSLALDRPGPSSILNVLPATVDALADDGPHRVNVRLSLARSRVPILARITRRSAATLALARGSKVYAQVKGVALVA